MRTLFRIFVILPVAVIAVMLAVANRRPVPLSFNPLDPANPATIIEVPVFWLVFACLAAGVVLGGVAVWFNQSAHRRAARENRYEAARLRAETDSQRKKLAAVEQDPSRPALAAPLARDAA